MLKLLLLVWVGLFVVTPAGAQDDGARGPIEAAGDAIQEKKSKEELEQQARLDALKESQLERNARVVVLQWNGSEGADYSNLTLQRNIRVRIATPGAKFYPEIDLYQAGRKERDRTLRPIDQRAVVPDSAIDRVYEVVESASMIPWKALTPQDWGLKAAELLQVAEDEIWFVDRPELREPLFLLYGQIGRAAENRNDSAPPFFAQVGGRPVNYFWYLAGAMAHEQPDLMAKLTDQDMFASIGYYKTLLDTNEIPPMTLAFDIDNEWDAETFVSDYKLFINGVEELVTDAKGLFRTAPGRVDVYMSRSDGHSLSDRIELDKLDEKFHFVRNVAKKKMGIDFQDQLMEHPYECTPEVDGDILNYLSIYARLHPQAEIYVAVPEAGSIAPNKIHLWRWDRPSGLLQKVYDTAGAFPVRFAFTVGAGMDFNNASYTPPDPNDVAEEAAQSVTPTGSTLNVDGVTRAVDALPKIIPQGFPVRLEGRAHYGRFLFNTGLQYAASSTGEWSDLYQTDTEDGPKHELQSTETVVVNVPNGTGVDCANTPELCTEQAVAVPVDVLRTRTWQRHVYVGTGVVLGPNAAIGFGPRFAFRAGWYNMPHAVDLSLHGGIAAQAPFSKKSNGRVRPLLDLDVYGGTWIPYRDSVWIRGDNKLGKPMADFGFVGSIGLTL